MSIEHLLGKIHNVDCLPFMRSLPDKCVDLVLCDLPYGTTNNKWDSVIPLTPLFREYKRLLRESGNVVLTGAQPFTSYLIFGNKFFFKYSLVWEKTTSTGFLNAKKMPLRKHEDVLVFYDSHGKYNPQKTTGHPRKVSSAAHKRNCVKTSNYGEYKNTGYDSTERYPTSVLKFATDKQKSSLHPTQKPVALFEWLVKTYSDKNDVVLDNCMGSGTTAVACERLGRKWFGCELEPKYCEIANKRIEAERAQLKLF